MHIRTASLSNPQSRFRMLFLAFTILLSFLLLPRLFGQSDLGAIRGSVQDQTGAIIPGASIELMNLDTGVSQTAVADGAGNFHFEALVRGNYQATVTAQGFQPEAQGITLNVSQI